jgi:Cdc6-like AAA superfamily ATPase
MHKFKLRKGLKIGDLAAENDRLLTKAFVDQGHIETLLDTADPRFLILGRTGSGKTGLIKQILQERSVQFATINPEELSMRYIHNAPVLRTLIDLGANLDVFYKFLWRHICVLEIIRMRYGNDEDVPSLIRQIIDVVSTSKRDESRAKAAAQDYLRSYGDQFWITADNRIKKIVDEVEVKFTSDNKVGAWLEANPVKVGGERNAGRSSRSSQAVEREIIDRVQSIVSDYLLADLRHVVQLLGKAGFNDPQKRYYLFIDDLDKNWMPDDGLYLDLTKSLLQTVSTKPHLYVQPLLASLEIAGSINRFHSSKTEFLRRVEYSVSACLRFVQLVMFGHQRQNVTMSGRSLSIDAAAF